MQCFDVAKHIVSPLGVLEYLVFLKVSIQEMEDSDACNLAAFNDIGMFFFFCLKWDWPSITSFSYLKNEFAGIAWYPKIYGWPQVKKSSKALPEILEVSPA